MGKHKTRTEALLKLRRERAVKRAGQGIGYFVPPTMSKDAWLKLRKTWDEKLRKSGHDEIEQFSHDCSGHFTPYFIKTHGNKTGFSGGVAEMARKYDPFKAEYYRRLGIFLHHANFHNIFRGRSRLYKRIVKHMSEGATLQAMLHYFEFKAPLTIRHKWSIFWIYTRVHEVNAKMAAWFKRYPEWLD